MFLFKKSFVAALLAATVLLASGAESHAASQFVFGKEPVARHNRAVAQRRAQTQSSYRTMASANRGTYYSQPMAARSTVTPVAGYRWSTASNNSGYQVR
jgi:hypothetical protein